MKQTTRGKPGIGTGRAPKPARLSPTARRLIRDEARSLGVTQDEYIRLTGTLFQTLRKAMADKQELDGKGLLQLVENPLFGMVIQYLAANVSKSPQSENAPSNPSQTAPLPSQNPSIQPFGQAQPPIHPQFGNPTVRPQPQQPQQRPAPNPNRNVPPEWQFW